MYTFKGMFKFKRAVLPGPLARAHLSKVFVVHEAEVRPTLLADLCIYTTNGRVIELRWRREEKTWPLYDFCRVRTPESPVSYTLSALPEEPVQTERPLPVPVINARP
ncbi:unnamed protein product [Leuciscus chuanchicus]